MQNLLAFLLINLFSVNVLAQSNLPACPLGTTYKDNCFGIHTSSNGGIYAGEFKDGKRHGQGSLTYANGNKYVGEFKDGKRQGLGSFFYLADNQFKGDKFIGNYKDDKSNGQGTHISTSGEIHAGEYKDGKLNGQGSITFANGNKYLGEFKDGKRNGQGTLNYANGNKYVGEWNDGQRNGQGIEYTSNGIVIRQGRWENGKLVQSFALDSQRFPFKLSGVSSTLLAFDLGESRKKQQDLAERLGASQVAVTQDNRPVVDVSSERRVALIIGNATYKINPLKNPVNDANDMARSLREVGFDVIEVNNATLVQMREATRRFADKLLNSDVGLVYYSGHGVEVRGRNYLIPVNADIKREYEVVDQAFDAS